MHKERESRLAEFVEWATAHITGDEKGQAQIFLDRLFIAFGRKGSLDVGGTAEMRIRKAKEDGGGTAFADFVWKPVVLVEMKKRGVDLSRHYRQAFDYWVRLVPDRPRYVVLCNFDRFDVYDFNKQIDAPVDSLAMTELPQRWGPLAFLFPAGDAPTFENDRVEVTRAAADRLAECFNKLIVRNVPRPLAQRFILQMLVALFAEDIGLLPRYLVGKLLDDCKEPADAYDILGDLFAAMNDPRPRTRGRFEGVRYFNGGLFNEPARVELYEDEVNQLKTAAKSDWSKVSPDIFGTLFQHSMDGDSRRAYGAHYTSPLDIMKIVGPTIVEPWREQIEGAKTLTRLRALQERMRTYRVLDPACGSGNFLYLAYRELKRLEARLFERTAEFASVNEAQQSLGFVTARQFYGLDVNPFAVELAKVTMMIGRKLAIDELHVHENALPLDNLDANFFCKDALIDELGNVAPWPPADAIIGNPPFIGSRYFAKERGYPYVRAVHKAYADVPKMADYCVYWFRRTHDHLPPCTPDDPVAGRAGLVGTQNIRNNASQVGGLGYVTQSGTIVEAVENQPWSGEANVHVSIVNWVKTTDPALLREKYVLWRVAEASPTARRRRGESSQKSCELEARYCDRINAALSDQPDVSAAQHLAANTREKLVFTGQNPCHDGFKLAPPDAERLRSESPSSSVVLFPYMTGLDLVSAGQPTRWVIDFGQRDILQCQAFPAAFATVKEKVMDDVLAKAANEKKARGEASTRWTRMAERWWQFRDWMPGTVAAVEYNDRYIVCPRVTKRPIFAFVSRTVRPDMQLIVFRFADDYSFGVLQASAHWVWFVAKCSKFKSDFRYTSDTVFDTFPWPQSPTKAQIDAVAAAGREVRRVRGEALKSIKGGLRAVYRTMELPGKNPLKDVHAALDAAVLAAYGFSPKTDLLAQLLALNLDVAAREKAGEPVTAPGVPPAYGNAATLVTEDCIRP